MFQGFTEKTIDFMWGIRFNNEKSWFEAQKEVYLASFYDPMKALSTEVYERYMENHGDLDLVNRVSRIYRDARRLHGKGPYKDRLWLSMERPKEEWTAQPVFWFELEPEGYSYGMGYYAASALTMAKFRARLDRDPKPFEKLARALQKQDVFVLDGADYKRPKGALTPLLTPWYNKKSFSLIASRPHESVLYSHDLADQVLAGFEFLTPFYQYLIALEGDPDPRT